MVRRVFFVHSQWDWQIGFIFLKWKFFDGWGSESEGGNKDLGSKVSWNTGEYCCIQGCNQLFSALNTRGVERMLSGFFFVTLFEHSEPQMRRHLELPKAESTAHVWSGALHLSFRVQKLSFPMKSRQRQYDLDLLKMFVFFLFPQREIHYLGDL